jgi:hypothetical protein
VQGTIAARQLMTACERVYTNNEMTHQLRIIKGKGAGNNGIQAIDDSSCERVFTKKASVKDF